MTQRHRVVIVGGGFAGVECAKALARVACDVTVVDSRNFHLFQPLLYQVATGGLSPGDIAAPLRTVVRDVDNVRVLQETVSDIDVDAKVLTTSHGALPYDTLVLCTGARHGYFGHDEWEQFAPGLKTLEDATEIRARVLRAFEAAEAEEDPEKRQALLRFCIVGGGPTGVELAGALGELSRFTMKGEFRRIESEDAKILLLEGGPRILSMYAPRLSTYAIEALQNLGVAVLVNTKVVGIDADGVDIETAQGKERLPSRTVLWAAGVQASPLGKVLEKKAGAKLDRAGRVVVESDLSIKGRPEIFVLGDLASFTPPHDKVALPGMSPVAMQMGRYCARRIDDKLQQRPSVPFSYFDKGTMAVIGRNHAVARLGVVGWGLTGFIAWLAWLFIHIVYLVGFENRLLVLLQWANHYLTRHRGARLIANSFDESR